MTLPAAVSYLVVALALAIPAVTTARAEPAPDTPADRARGTTEGDYARVLRRMLRLSRAFIESDRKLARTFKLTDDQRATVEREYETALAGYDALLRKLDEGGVPSLDELRAAAGANLKAERNMTFALEDKSVDLMKADRPRYQMTWMAYSKLWNLTMVDATPEQFVRVNRVVQPLFDLAAECPPVAPADGNRAALDDVGRRANDALRAIGPEMRKILNDKQWKQMSEWDPTLTMRHLRTGKSSPPAR